MENMEAGIRTDARKFGLPGEDRSRVRESGESCRPLFVNVAEWTTVKSVKEETEDACVGD